MDSQRNPPLTPPHSPNETHSHEASTSRTNEHEQQAPAQTGHGNVEKMDSSPGHLNELDFLEELKQFSEKSADFVEYFQTIVPRICELLSTKTAADHEFIEEFLDEWLRIAKLAPDTMRLFLFDLDFAEFQKMAKLLLQIGCISTQLKIMAIFFSYALYEDDVDSHKRISSLFQNLVENCDSICSLIDLSRIRNKPFGDVVRRLLNIINVNSMTKVVSKRIKSLHFHDGGKMINTIPILQNFVDFNVGTKTADIMFHLNFSAGLKATINNENLQSVWIKDVEGNSVKQMSFKLIKPININWISLNSRERSSVSLGEFAMEFREDMDRDELETLCQEMFPGKFKIVVTAMFHAENTYEPIVDRVEVKSIRPKPKPQSNLDEIFSIPLSTDWREISKNLDSYRPKVDLTPIPSDDEDFNSNNESSILSQSKDRLDVTIEEKPRIKSPLTEKEHQFLSNAFAKTCQMDKANKKTIPQLSVPDREYQTVASVHQFIGGGGGVGSGQKRASLDLRDRIDSKRPCRLNDIHSCERVDKNVPSKHRPSANYTIGQLITSRIETKSAPKTYRPKDKDKDEQNFGPHPRWNQSQRRNQFDEIANTTTYERGQWYPPPSYSYRNRFQPSPSQTTPFNGSEDSNSD